MTERDDNLDVVRNWLSHQSSAAYAGSVADRATAVLRAALHLSETVCDKDPDELLGHEEFVVVRAALARYQEALSCLTN